MTSGEVMKARKPMKRRKYLRRRPAQRAPRAASSASARPDPRRASRPGTCRSSRGRMRCRRRTGPLARTAMIFCGLRTMRASPQQPLPELVRLEQEPADIEAQEGGLEPVPLRFDHASRQSRPRKSAWSSDASTGRRQRRQRGGIGRARRQACQRRLAALAGRGAGLDSSRSRSWAKLRSAGGRTQARGATPPTARPRIKGLVVVAVVVVAAVGAGAALAAAVRMALDRMEAGPASRGSGGRRRRR